MSENGAPPEENPRPVSDGQRRREAKLRRMAGMSPEAKKALNDQLEAKTDWRGTCTLCGAVLSGTMAELRGHKCDATP